MRHKRLFSELKEATQKTNGDESHGSESRGIPWGLLASVGVISGLVGWFYRSYKNGKLLQKFRDELKQVTVLSPDEIEAIRSANHLSLPTFKIILDILSEALDGKENVLFDDFMKLLESVLKAQGGEGIKAAHLLERLQLFLNDYNSGKPIAVDFCFLVLTFLLDSSVEERLEEIYLIYSKDGRLDLKTLERLLADLKLSFQLPVRVLSKEVKAYPFNDYCQASEQDLLADSFKQVVKARKKKKTLTDEFKTLSEAYQKLDANENTSLAYDDFQDLLLANAVCVWGECN